MIVTVFGFCASSRANELSQPEQSLNTVQLNRANPALTPLDAESIPSGVPLSMLQLRGDYRYALAVDLSANQLFVFANNNGTPELVNSYFATIGKAGYGKQREGDNRTPVGVYRIQDFIDDNSLPELYGRGALPLDFPNAWDRKLGRTGHGIWIHGMPRDQERRPARDSEGCVVVSNNVVPDLHNWSELKSTPVVLADQLRWTDPLLVNSAREALLDDIERWRAAWSAGDMDSFLAMHSPEFRTRTQRFKNYAKQKRRLAKARGRVGVQLEEFEMFMYPDVDHQAMAMVSFKQRYDSKQFKDVTYKTQFWQHNGERWMLQLERSVRPWPSEPINGKMVASVETE
ncbi:MAG: L,D-transpeptidase family protein [Granulosicoccaceae bacterium]